MTRRLHQRVPMSKGKSIDLTEPAQRQDFDIIEEDLAKDGGINREGAPWIALDGVGGGTIMD